MEVSKLREEFLNKLQKEEYISNYLFENIKNTIPDIMMSLKCGSHTYILVLIYTSNVKSD